MIAVCVILIILLLLLIVIIWPHKVRLQANIDENGLRANFFMLSVFRGYVFSRNSKLYLHVCLFGNRIISIGIKRKHEKKNTFLWLKSADIYNIKVDAFYGLKDPFSTGIASGALGFVSSFIRPDEINVYPDFFSDKAYLKISATAEVDIGNTLIRFAENKRNKTRRRSEWSKA